MNKEVAKFKELVAEATFLVRALFFLLFGFLIENAELLNTKTFTWAIGIVVAVFLFRIIQFSIFKLELFPMVFIAPRGLINILLFLSIVPAQNIQFVNKSLLIQVVILSALVLMFGLMFTSGKQKKLPATNKIENHEES